MIGASLLVKFVAFKIKVQNNHLKYTTLDG